MWLLNPTYLCKKKTTMKKVFGILMIVAATMTISSCAKYDEGSNFTLLTAKSRIVNVWKVSAWTANGNNILALNTYEQFDVKKDNTIAVTENVFGTTDNGTWAFNDDKSMFIWTKSNGNINEYTILKLSKDEMKISSTSAGVEYIMTLVTK
jgi:uncharacterized membrane protein